MSDTPKKYVAGLEGIVDSEKASQSAHQWISQLSGSAGAPPGSFNHFVGSVARIGIANGFSVPVDSFGESHRVEYRFLEDRMQKLDDKF